MKERKKKEKKRDRSGLFFGDGGGGGVFVSGLMLFKFGGFEGESFGDGFFLVIVKCFFGSV